MYYNIIKAEGSSANLKYWRYLAMQYKQVMTKLTDENLAFLHDMKCKGQTMADTINLAIETYRAVIEDQTTRRRAAAAKQEAAAQRHVDELFETMEFRTEVFKQAWVAAVLDRFEDYVDVI